MQEFLPELIVLQADPTAPVRKFLPEFLEACPPSALQAASLRLALQCLQGLLQDEIAAVVKAAVMASGPIFRAAFAVVAGQVATLKQAIVQPHCACTVHKKDLQMYLQVTPHDAIQGVWQSADTLRYSIGTAMTDHTVPGVRLQATKFLEHIVLLFTADTVPVLTAGSKATTMQRLTALRTKLTPALVSSSFQQRFVQDKWAIPLSLYVKMASQANGQELLAKSCHCA